MYQYQPHEKVHVVTENSAESNGHTLCGIAHEGDVREVGDDPDNVLPKHIQCCQRCRAAYVKRVIEALDVDVTMLSEGDRIEYWSHNDPTDPSESLCVREVGNIVEVPPWTETYDGEDEIITERYEVSTGGNMYTWVKFDRIWRVIDS